MIVHAVVVRSIYTVNLAPLQSWDGAGRVFADQPRTFTARKSVLHSKHFVDVGKRCRKQ